MEKLLREEVAVATREVWWEKNEELEPGKVRTAGEQLKKAQNEEVAKNWAANCNKPKVM